MSEKHKVIVIPGLGDQRIKPLEVAVGHWRLQGLEPIVHAVGWHDGENSFKPKLKRLIEMIDRFSQEGDKVSLVGTSAGGSAALNAFIERKDVVHRIINVCGRLRVGPETGFRSFDSKSKSSPSFAESVKLCEVKQERLSDQDKRKIMTVRALFGDEIVPSETTIVEGAFNTKVPTPEHMFSIWMSLTLYSRPIIVFLKKE